MDKILLLNLPRASSGEYMRREEYCFGVTDFIQLPMHLANISGVLKKKDVDVEFVDANRDNLSLADLAKYLREDEPDVVVCAVTISHILEESKIVQICKDFNIKCVGIAVPRGYAENFAAEYDFYFTIYAEPEKVISDFVDGVERSSLTGVVYIKEGKTVKTQHPPLTFKDLPSPDWDLIDPGRYERIQYQFARGCPYHCTFCTWGKVPWQLKPVDTVLADLDALIARGKGVVWLDGAQITTNKKWLDRFCTEKKRRGNNILFTVTIRANEVDRDVLEKLKDAGCYGVFAGIESVNQKVLDSVDKKLTVEQCRDMIRACRDVDLPLSIFILFGIGESDEDVNRYIQFVSESKPAWLACGLVNVYKGTLLYDKEYTYDVEKANERYRRFYSSYLRLKERKLGELRWLYEMGKINCEEYERRNMDTLQTIRDINEHLRRRGGQITVNTRT